MLYAKDRGCTFPGCPVPGYGCQVHHAQTDWAKGGLTNIDEETLACAPHNRLITEGGWQTRKRKDGRTEWIPHRTWTPAKPASTTTTTPRTTWWNPTTNSQRDGVAAATPIPAAAA